MTDRQIRYLSLALTALFVVVWGTAFAMIANDCGAFSELVNGVCYAR